MRDWVEVVKAIEAVYPSSAGGASKDDTFRQQLSGYANSLFKEVEREQRWALAYTTGNIAVVAGTATYALPTGQLSQQQIYYLDSSGTQHQMDKYAQEELRRVYGEGASSARGAPVAYALLGSSVQFFPVPDASYTMVVEGYQQLNQIVETSGTTTAASATLTVPSTAYLTDLGLAAAGTSGLSVRGAGNLGVGSVADTHVTSWTAFPTAATVTMGTAAVTAVPALGAQVFFNSQNWLITGYDKVVLFGVLRMCGTYLKSEKDYGMWEARYQHEMDMLRAHDFDRTRTLEVFATAHQGQRQSQLRRQDALVGVDVRGGVI